MCLCAGVDFGVGSLSGSVLVVLEMSGQRTSSHAPDSPPHSSPRWKRQANQRSSLQADSRFDIEANPCQLKHALVLDMISTFYWASAVLAVFISVFALEIMGLFSRKNHLDVDGKVWQAF